MKTTPDLNMNNDVQPPLTNKSKQNPKDSKQRSISDTTKASLIQYYKLIKGRHLMTVHHIFLYHLPNRSQSGGYASNT